jgi:hypothetical protein
MTKIRKMDQTRLDRLLRDITVRSEAIRSLQDEKQSVIDEFRREHDRLRSGKISENAFTNSADTVTNQLSELDRKIRESMRGSASLTRRVLAYVESQQPEIIKATTRGLRKEVERKRRRATRTARTARTARSRRTRRTAERTTAQRTTRSRAARQSRRKR